jgi:hypothetical protein
LPILAKIRQIWSPCRNVKTGASTKSERHLKSSRNGSEQKLKAPVSIDTGGRFYETRAVRNLRTKPYLVKFKLVIVALDGLKYLKILHLWLYHQDKCIPVDFGWKFVQNFRIKICRNSFRLKRSFVKSIRQPQKMSNKNEKDKKVLSTKLWNQCWNEKWSNLHFVELAFAINC